MKNQQGIIPLVVIVAVGIVSASGLTVAASQSSIPGDALYPVKKVTENVRVATAFSKKDKAKVHLDIAEEKVKEIEKLEEKGATDKITEAAQGLEDSQDQALELTETIKSEGENVDELTRLLEVQSNRQQVVITRISPKISVQAGESLRKSLEQFREELKITIESEEEEKEEDSEQEEDDDNSNPNQTPCPSPTSQDEDSDQEDEDNYQGEEDTSSDEDVDEDWDDYWERKYWDANEDVQGISQLRNSQNSSNERSSGGGSSTFDGGAGSSGSSIEGGTDISRDPCDTNEIGGDQGESVGAPTSTAPDVEGVSTTGGLLQFILNALFPPQKR